MNETESLELLARIAENQERIIALLEPIQKRAERLERETERKRKEGKERFEREREQEREQERFLARLESEPLE